MRIRNTMPALAMLALTSASLGAVSVDYLFDAGGNNPFGPDGLSARATFEVSGNQLTILLENTSTGAPMDAEVADTVLVSLGFNLPDGILINSGVGALIGPGSVGLGEWDDRMEGDSVGEQWLWTNEFGADVLADFAQMVSTSSGTGGGAHMRFDGVANGNVGGPYGGIVADPPVMALPDDRPGVSDSIAFTMMLNDTLSEMELADVANNSIVEMGSDFQYLAVPAPAALPALLMPFLIGRRRRS